MLVEPELRPLVQAALERHQAIEVDDDDRRRHVEQDHRDQPEDDVRRSLFGGDANPRQADDEQDLRQGEVAKPQLPTQITSSSWIG